MRWITRFAWAGSGLFWFVWLGYEDRGSGVVLGLAATLCVSVGITIAARGFGAESKITRSWLLYLSFLGTILGAAVTPVAVILMSLKVSLHDHPIQDFTPSDVVSVIKLVPVWITVGTLMGIAGGLLAGVRKERER